MHYGAAIVFQPCIVDALAFSTPAFSVSPAVVRTHSTVWSGATENAGVENAIRSKLQGWKIQEWKMRE